MGNSCFLRAHDDLDVSVIRMHENLGFDHQNIEIQADSNVSRLEVGSELMVRDKFQSKYTKETKYKWRKVSVEKVKGDTNTGKFMIFVHFIGWSKEFDFWIDVKHDSDRIAPLDFLSQEEINEGKELSEKQISDIKIYFKEKIDMNRSRDRLSIDTSKSSTSFSKNDSEEFHVGQVVEAIDIHSKDYRMREAKILEVIRAEEGTREVVKAVKISYSDLSTKYDCWLDLVSYKNLIRPISHSSLSSNVGRRVDIVLRPSTDAVLDEVEMDMSSLGKNNEYEDDRDLQKLLEKQRQKELDFRKKLKERGFSVVEIAGDGNCLFRAISHQIFSTEEHHSIFREKCVKHLRRKHFLLYVMYIFYC